MDRHFGSELVTQKGRIYVFDSIECLAAFSLSSGIESSQVHSLWVTSFDTPAELIDAEAAFFLHSKSLRSPMGMNLSAYNTEPAAQEMQAKFDGEIIKWEQVFPLVKTAWLDGSTNTTRMSLKKN